MNIDLSLVKKFEYNLDESTLNDIKTRETDYKFILSNLKIYKYYIIF